MPFKLNLKKIFVKKKKSMIKLKNIRTTRMLTIILPGFDGDSAGGGHGTVTLLLERAIFCQNYLVKIR